ncbi:hypothetical protein E0500_023600 [Streptomyces sp. KM273126]|uniref:hypothetical protein n=1 Tax=Streptomyces sp. KM273126 TaxID=2545247 RepID=UPI0015EC2080|nr:hypothetical protein [Streptomyces sp. KM273126]MBA2810293.1 hypothetical protein [Streptomyces sp. KM273126]
MASGTRRHRAIRWARTYRRRRGRGTLRWACTSGSREAPGLYAVTDREAHVPHPKSAEVMVRPALDAELPSAEWVRRTAERLPT